MVCDATLFFEKVKELTAGLPLSWSVMHLKWKVNKKYWWWARRLIKNNDAGLQGKKKLFVQELCLSSFLKKEKYITQRL